jgi:hypothetical protein
MTFLGTFCVSQYSDKYFERERKQLLPNIQKSNVLIYHDLLNDNDIKNCIKIAKFCKIILIAIN